VANILITGASGFLGSALALHFSSDGHKVTVLARPTSSMGRLGGRDASVNIVRAEGDRAVNDAVCEADADLVIHTACSYGRENESPLAIFDANLRLGMQLIQAALRLERHVTFINTGTVLDRSVNDYALSKVQFAEWGRHLAARLPERMTFVNVLLQHMYGPGDDSSKFTTWIVQRCPENNSHIRLTPGGQRRDFIYIDDVVSAFAALARQALAGQATSIDVEIGSGEAPTIREFVVLAHRLATSSARLDFGAVPYRTNEAMLYRADLTRMRSIGWAPRVPLAEGLRRTIQAERDAAARHYAASSN
jgi:CDP-paratose synthetase